MVTTVKKEFKEHVIICLIIVRVLMFEMKRWSRKLTQRKRII
jgi:hypothetical protein